MNKLAYDAFFEKVALTVTPGLSAVWKALNPAQRDIARGVHQFLKPAKQIVVPKAPSKLGTAMTIGMPVAFMGMEGFGATKRVAGGVHNLPSAKSLPQTFNPWQTF